MREEVIGPILGALCAGAVAMVNIARDWHYRAPATTMARKAGVEFRFWDEAGEWLIGPAPYLSGCAASIGLLLLAAALALYASGFLLAFVIPVIAVLGGTRFPERPRTIGPELVRMAQRARDHAEKFRATDDLERADAAHRMAELLAELHRHRPALTMQELEAYYTPVEIADALEGWFFTDGDGYPLQRWLDEAPDEMAWEDNQEQSRVKLLAEVRQELEEGGGVEFKDIDRVSQLIRQLRAWPENV